MTRNELSQLWYLNREIEQDKARLAELEGMATSSTGNISGMPHASGISDKTAIACEIADYREIIDEKIKMCFAQFNSINRYISTIDDSMVRQIMQYRFVSGLSWTAVAMHIGGDNTADGMRKIIARYCAKDEE